jgi:hypothetical protein
MSVDNSPEKFYLYLNMGDVLDQDQLDTLTRQLQTELLDQDIENADLLRGDELPEGAKAVDVITWGAIAIEVLPKFLPGVVEFLKSWVMREESRNVKIKTQVGEKSIELEYSSKGIKDEEVKDLVSILAASLKEASPEVEETSVEETVDEEPLSPTAEEIHDEESVDPNSESKAEEVETVEEDQVETPIVEVEDEKEE